MKLRTTRDGLLIEDPERGAWVSLPAALAEAGVQDWGLSSATDALRFLRGGGAVRESATALLATVREAPGVVADPATAILPFAPRSIRAFMLYESHVIASSRMLVKNFFPAPMWRAVSTYERVTKKPFPKLVPNAHWRSTPAMYLANHTGLVADGQEMWWPKHTKALDFELELACVLTKPLADATPEEAEDAVGGWFVLNDWSARDVQALDARKNIFGPVIKAKSFANGIGSDVVTADAVPDWTAMRGRVRVDGEQWCEGTTAGPQHTLGAMLAFASAGERLQAGDVISTGTIPGCCGLELDRWIKPGQSVELEIDGIGTLTNRISATARPG